MKITYNPVNDYYDEVIKKNKEEIKKCMTCPVCGNRVNNLDNGLETGIIPERSGIKNVLISIHYCKTINYKFYGSILNDTAS